MRNENFAIKREQRKFIYSAEREQSQDRKAGLKEKSTPSASLVPPVSGGQSERKGEMKSGKETCEV